MTASLLPARRPRWLRLSLSRKFTWSVLLIFGLLLATAGLALQHAGQMSRTITDLRSVELERLWLTASVNEEANDGARKLIVLLAAPPELREQARAEIDAAERRLDSAMTLLATLLDGGERHPQFAMMSDSVQRYRRAYRKAARLIESGDHEGARRAIIEQVDMELSVGRAAGATAHAARLLRRGAAEGHQRAAGLRCRRHRHPLRGPARTHAGGAAAGRGPRGRRHVRRGPAGRRRRAAGGAGAQLPCGDGARHPMEKPCHGHVGDRRLRRLPRPW